MLELARHIEVLLLSNDCVIIPDFGGFVAQYTPALYLADEQTFEPPRRELCFSPSLRRSDGLLSESYMVAHDVNYPEATLLVEQAVRDLEERLQRSGEVEFDGIGRLTLGQDGRLLFAGEESGVDAPDLYALPAARDIVPHATAQKDSTPRVAACRPRKTSVHYTLHINKDLVNYLAAAVCTLFFYFLCSVPNAQLTTGSIQTENQLRGGLSFASPNAGSTPSGPGAETSKTSAKAAHKTSESKAERNTEERSGAADTTAVRASSITDKVELHQSQSTPKPVPNHPVSPTRGTVAGKTLPGVRSACETDKKPGDAHTAGSFTIVLASSVPLSGAKQMVEHMTRAGIEGGKVMQKGRMVRVVYGSYTTEIQARAAIRQGRKKSDYFSQAWVLDLK